MYTRVAEIFVPNARSIPDPYFSGDTPGKEKSRLIGWWVPVDNTHTHTVGFHIEALPVVNGEVMQPALANAVEGRTSATMPARTSYEETQREPDDREAQVSQGPIAPHHRVDVQPGAVEEGQPQAL